MSKLFCFLTATFFIVGCGVKGDPAPPLRPTEMSRGKPTYKRAMQKIKKDKPVSTEEDEDDAE